MSEQPQLIQGLHAEFKPAVWSGSDTSGVKPIGPTVIVLCDECSELSSGGVALPLEYVERMNLAAEQGVIVAVARGAFVIHEDGSAWRDYRPKPGDRVYYEKYAGRLVMGKDKRRYRIMDYKSIGAIYEMSGAGEPQANRESA